MVLLYVLGTVLSIVGIGVDWYYSSVLTDAGSQLEALLMSIRVGASLEDFVSQCWMFIVLGICVLWMGLSIAFPKRRSS